MGNIMPLNHVFRQDLAEGGELFKSFFDDSPAGKSMTSLEGILIYTNTALSRILGYSIEELAKLSFADITYPDDLPESRECVRSLIAGEKAVWDFEKRYITKDGRIIWAQVMTRLVRDKNGKPQCLATHVQDITARKRAEQALISALSDLERSNIELEQFAYVASHDLQEPLRMVSSYTQLLAHRYKDKLDQDARDFIGYAVDGANRMQRLIGDLLAFSRINTRGKELESMDLFGALGEAIANLSDSIRETGAIVANTDLPVVIADYGQIVELFQNLIGNGIKYRGETPPRITVSAERGANEWLVSVKDNGIGIEAQYNTRIFQMFQRLHTSDKYSGTGIGLAICKRIIERHRGRIWVDSEPGKGSIFKFTIPDSKGEHS